MKTLVVGVGLEISSIPGISIQFKFQESRRLFPQDTGLLRKEIDFKGPGSTKNQRQCTVNYLWNHGSEKEGVGGHGSAELCMH